METEPEIEPQAEIPLLGGRLTPDIVRVGNTVRRLPKSNAPFVHDLLLFLENQDFPFAPRFLGMDSRGREILSYLEGETWPDSGSGLSDDLLIQAAKAIRRYHDVTVGSLLAQGHEIVAHQELGPHNTIFHHGHWWALSIGTTPNLPRGCATWLMRSTILSMSATGRIRMRMRKLDVSL